MNSKTAILIFANSANYEATLKPFHKSVAVFDALNKQIKKTVEKTKIPYFLFTEENQKGSSFGERYVNAITTVFESGYDSVITIGNDSPLLKPKHLLDAFAQINNNKTVVGASKDGGFYLIGLKKENFHKQEFSHLPWQTGQLLSSLSDLLKKSVSSISYLETLSDIDTLKDIKQFLHKHFSIPTSLRRILLSIFLSEKKIIGSIIYLKRIAFSSTFYNKGSPLFT